MRKLKDCLNATLEPFQKEGVLFSLNHNYSIIGDEMGLGKTIQGISVSLATQLPTLVVCPAYLKNNWYSEFNRFSLDPLKIKVTTTGDYGIDGDEDVVITSYASLKEYGDKYFQWAKLIIGDEFHYVKNPTTSRGTQFYVLTARYKPERLLGLSGTPVKNNITEFYNPLRVCSLNPAGNSGLEVQEYFNNHSQWCNHFSNKHKFKVNGRYVIKYTGQRNLEQFKLFTKGKYIRRLQKDVLKDLPPLREKMVYLDTGDNEELLEAFKEFESKGKFLMSVKAHAAFLNSKATAQYAKELYDETQEPIVIFSDHVGPISEIVKWLGKKHKNKCAVITGNVSPARRDELVKGFQEGKYTFLLGTIGAASTGFNMTKSRNVVFNDIPWVPGDLDQAKKRIHRYTQTGMCTAHYIISDSVNKRILEYVQDKSEGLKEIL